MTTSILYSVLFLALSIVAAFVIAGLSARYAGDRLDGRYVSYGMGMFFVGIALHSLIALPVVIAAQGPLAILRLTRTPPAAFEPWHLVYFAVAAGIGQELAKVLPLSLEMKRAGSGVRSRNLGWLGLLVGLGFSASEIIVIATSSWQPVMEGLGLRNVLLGGLERTSATFFHMGTAAWIGAAIARGTLRTAIVVCIALHAGLDAIAGLLAIETTRGIIFEEAALFAFSATFFLLVFRTHVRPVAQEAAA